MWKLNHGIFTAHKAKVLVSFHCFLSKLKKGQHICTVVQYFSFCKAVKRACLNKNNRPIFCPPSLVVSLNQNRPLNDRIQTKGRTASWKGMGINIWS